jgi:hypothetical protein
MNQTIANITIHLLHEKETTVGFTLLFWPLYCTITELLGQQQFILSLIMHRAEKFVAV